jgi:inhibitor of KinA sporulation pathway (predicted exonuclease)
MQILFKFARVKAQGSLSNSCKSQTAVRQRGVEKGMEITDTLSWRIKASTETAYREYETSDLLSLSI